MKLDKETIVKQRFWFLLGGCVPLLLIIWLVLVFGVSGAVTEQRLQQNRLVAIQELGALGGAAEKAVPVLQDIARDDARATLRQAAEAALKKIKGS